ncbi:MULTISPECIES: extracellular solute-binding protein [Achromobacter]|uniref:Extracellular solute-binding protein n=1 Tax=Achromobacter aegrifaciens TaxID=1287736 RepID=A0ABU2DDS8_ACHAE|nr:MULTISPECIES: extracellular solute-binding protein [Achromobacter]PTN50266.1 spermidine/putrescine ABC transporter substrate-binding protein [Achromobacter xylosoxidans]MBD9382766.1 extracellular solute-binding protein [Achromobacter sp. ACM02]MBD9423130.1 extracellular solute-binding protein [Achromobacter sp. ACM04]MBD9471346.1 extracellular solute-binding protein [Achromobacter sp. ACM01]MDQ1764318.1 extracellular solute-binding protein [Achromobacter aegrifaciens]
MTRNKQDGQRRLGAGRRLLGAALAVLLSAGAAAQQTTLYVGMNGGDMARAFSQYVFPDFERAHNVRIVVVPGMSTEVLARAQADKGKPRLHLMFLDDGVMARAISMGLCTQLNEDPVLKELYPTALKKDRMAAGIDIGMTGLGYNTKVFAERGWAPPTSWMDLADPKYRGQVVVQSASSSTFGLHAFLMINRILGGDDQNYGPGFAHWPAVVGPNVRAYLPDSARLADMVQADEAVLFPWTPTAITRLKKRGVHVEYAQPREGSMILMVGECVVAGNSEPELSQKLALYLLSEQAQAKALEMGGHFPSNRNVLAPAGHADALQRFQGYMSNAKIPNWDQINETRPAFNARWNREIGR